jgi:hypothetical protein
VTELNDDSTLRQAKVWLHQHMQKGVDCPLCGQMAKIYCRPMTSSEAYGLTLFYNAHGMEWGHAPSVEGIAELGGAFARNAHWGLLEESSGKRDDGGRMGWWRVTALGQQFIETGRTVSPITVPKNLYMYDGEILDRSEKRVNIRQALGRRFRLNELMGWIDTE